MNSSDKENIKDDLPDEKPNRYEKHSENEKTEETFQEKEFTCDTPVNSQVKRKSESRFGNRRKWSTDNVQKESDHLSDCENRHDTDLSVINSTKYEKQLSPVTVPYNKNGSIEERTNQADQSTTQEKNIKSSEESNSAIQEIKASIIQYLSSAIDPSGSEQYLENIFNIIGNSIIHALKKLKEEIVAEQQNSSTCRPMTENIHSKSSEIYLSNKDGTETKDENLIEKEQVGDNELSKFLESENSCAKCKQDKLRPIISPWKRKSEEIVDDEVKRKRNADNAPIEVRNEENLTDISNAQDSELYVGNTRKPNNHLVNTMESIDDTAKGCVNERDMPIHQTDQSARKYEVTTGETDHETRKIQTSNNESTQDQIQCSDGVVLLEESGISSPENCSITFVDRNLLSSFLDNVKEGGIINPRNEIKDEPTSEDRLRDSKKDISTENLNKFRNFSKNPDLKHPKNREDKSVKFPSDMSNTDKNISSDINLEMRKSSADASKSEVSNVSKSCKHTHSEEYLSPQVVIGDHGRNRNFRFSAVKSFSDSECDLNPIYYEPESEFINLEKLENNPIFIEKQRRMLEDISLQRQEMSSMKPESDEKVKFPKPLEDKGPNDVGPEISNKLDFKICDLVRILANNLISEGTDIRLLNNSSLISRFIGVAEVYDPDIISSIYSNIIEHRERTRQLLEAIKFDYDRFTRESPEKNDRPLNPVAFEDRSPGNYNHNVSPLSQVSSTPKCELNGKISETDLPEIREHPGSAANPKSVKKDARYPKKNYKRKTPIALPANRCIDEPSSSKIKQNKNYEEDQIQSFGDDLPVVSKNEDDVHEEKSQENSKIVLNNNLLKENSDDTLSAEKSTKVKKHSKHQKRLYRLKPVTLPVNCSGDADSSEIEPNIDSDTNQIQRIDDQRISSVQEESEEDPKNLLKDNMFKETEQYPDDKLSGTSAITSEYKISSFMEESPNSSQSNSPKRNNECTLPSMLEIIPKFEGLVGTSMSSASQISSSEARAPRSPTSEARPPPANMG